MRTTLDIEKPVLDELKKLQKRGKKPLGQIASSLLAQAMKDNISSANDPSDHKLHWTTANMGARVDISDKDGLYRILDER